ncbi:MarC family protein [soil metagenome]
MSEIVNATLLAEVFITLFVIVDPPGTIPLFLALTRGQAKAEHRRAAWQAVTVSFAVIVLFALFGRQLLQYLHISLPALQGAGGLLLLLVALELLTGRDGEPRETRDVNVALVPLGTPLLAGPGAIVATMVFVERIDDAPTLVAVAAGIVGVHAVLWLTMRYSVAILALIRNSGVTLVTRISGLLLSAIAVQLIADSVRAFVEGKG